ncbi:MAG: HD domain-containing protein [Candidatus Falkowbacteria bacterium]|nr:HD domain-containing protein [Candidatus Falkowbacteria bacterium]
MKIPLFVKNIINTLSQNNYEAYIVGGSVRDLLLGKEPKDWDITTNALPEKTVTLFTDAKYENRFGTVIVPLRNEAGELENVVEVTTYRSEQGYSDRRHPDEIVFEDNLEADLGRRDFSINALAMDGAGKITDLFNGEKDLRLKVIRTVGEPSDRFKEDALRMMRAVRFSCQLGFTIEGKTERAITKLAGSIKFVANERIRDELVKILSSDSPAAGIIKLQELKLLHYIIPELEEGIEMKQNHHHIYNVFDHAVLALKNCPNKQWQVRLASLMHDIGKPRTRKIVNNAATFYNHEIVGAKIVERFMKRLNFSTEDSKRVVNLVRNHMFYYNVDEVTAASVRRLIVKVGEENLSDLIDLRIADRLGSGVAKAMPYKLRHLQYMMDKVRHDPVSVKMLKINGEDLMELLKVEPGPQIGAILDVLLAEVIDDPELNNRANLEARSRDLVGMPLAELRAKAKELISEKREEEDQKIKKDYYVK